MCRLDWLLPGWHHWLSTALLKFYCHQEGHEPLLKPFLCWCGRSIWWNWSILKWSYFEKFKFQKIWLHAKRLPSLCGATYEQKCNLGTLNKSSLRSVVTFTSDMYFKPPWQELHLTANIQSKATIAAPIRTDIYCWVTLNSDKRLLWIQVYGTKHLTLTYEDSLKDYYSFFLAWKVLTPPNL